MVGNEVEDDLHAPLVRRGEQFRELFLVAEVIVYLVVIHRIVAVHIEVRRGTLAAAVEDRRKPYRVAADFVLDIVEFRGDAPEIPYPVAVVVAKGFDPNVVKGRVYPPIRREPDGLVFEGVPIYRRVTGASVIRVSDRREKAGGRRRAGSGGALRGIGRPGGSRVLRAAGNGGER